MKKGYVYIGLAALLFSTMEIALKLFSLGLNPIQLNFLRFATGALVLLPLALRNLRKRPALKPSDYGFFALAGFVCVVLSMTLYQIAVTRSLASVVAVIFSCNPVFVVPFAALFLGERITWRTVAALAASVAGIACIAVPAFLAAGGGAAAGGSTRPLDVPGIVLTILSSLTFALYGVLGKARSGRYGGVLLTSFSFTAGALELLALIALSHLAPLAAGLDAAGLGVFARIPVFAGLHAGSLPGFLYIAAAITGFGYAFWFLGMENTSAQAGSIVFFIKPALAPLLAALVLGEGLGPTMLAGMVLIVAGSALMLPRRAKAGAAAKGRA